MTFQPFILSAEVVEQNVNNKKTMCHLSMNLSDKYDPNPLHISDKIVVKHISVKETFLKLDLEPKCQGQN